MTMKKLLKNGGLGLATLVLIVAGAGAFSAFEAHVINVTARIENALNVPVRELQFGTVFPQEKLDKTFDVTLSGSFLAEDRVDDVEYVIRQKPKCGVPIPETDPVEYSSFVQVGEDNRGNFICPEGSVELPLLCPYLSKHELTTDGREQENDSAGIFAFHGLPGPWTLATTIATEVKGRLVKAAEDITDKWNIDLKVPCFGGNCAQDWNAFVQAANPEFEDDPYLYVADPKLQHEIFGCDLWLEVTGISLPGLGCKDELDVMLVLDRSGSISDAELATLKTASKVFVDALAPTTAGVHMGQSSFSTSATLDLHLSDDSVAIKAAIDAVDNGGTTNLAAGIDLATGELDNSHVIHERPTVDDIMIIITDGEPNVPNTTDGKANAIAEADAARAAGIKVFVVGIGVNAGAELFLKNNIADDPTQYFAAADFDDLEQILKDLAKCPETP